MSSHETNPRILTQAARRARADKARKLLDILSTDVLLYGLLIIISVITIIPLFWALATSLKTFKEVVAYPPVFWPPDPQWENYLPVFQNWDLFGFMRNSFIIAFGSAVGQVVASSLSAYAFAKLKSPIRDALFGLVLSTIMLPHFVTLIPVYIIFYKFKLIDSFGPFLIPAWLGGGAWNIFLLRQFFKTVPDELLDAARVDGASELRVFAQIVAPQAKPALATIFLFSFMGGWNDYFGPYIYLMSKRLWPLTLALVALTAELTPNLPPGVVGSMTQNIVMAASLVITLPLLILFLFTQRYFIEGITITGMKG